MSRHWIWTKNGRTFSFMLYPVKLLIRFIATYTYLSHTTICIKQQYILYRLWLWTNYFYWCADRPILRDVRAWNGQKISGGSRQKKSGFFRADTCIFEYFFGRVWHFLERAEKTEKNLLYTWKVVNLNLTDRLFFI